MAFGIERTIIFSPFDIVERKISIPTATVKEGNINMRKRMTAAIGTWKIP